MSMSGRDLEEMRRLANEAYSPPVAARYERTLAKYLLSAIDEVAELKEGNEKLDKQNTDLIQRLDDCSRVADGGLKIQAQQKKEAAELREENDWMRRWMGEFGYTEAFEGWRKFKTPAPENQRTE